MTKVLLARPRLFTDPPVDRHRRVMPGPPRCSSLRVMRDGRRRLALVAHDHVKALLRIATLGNVPASSNRATADPIRCAP